MRCSTGIFRFKALEQLWLASEQLQFFCNIFPLASSMDWMIFTNEDDRWRIWMEPLSDFMNHNCILPVTKNGTERHTFVANWRKSMMHISFKILCHFFKWPLKSRSVLVSQSPNTCGIFKASVTWRLFLETLLI